MPKVITWFQLSMYAHKPKAHKTAEMELNIWSLVLSHQDMDCISMSLLCICANLIFLM